MEEDFQIYIRIRSKRKAQTEMSLLHLMRINIRVQYLVGFVSAIGLSSDIKSTNLMYQTALQSIYIFPHEVKSA